MKQIKSFIDGKWVESQDKTLKRSPVNGAPIAEIHSASAEMVDQAVRAGKRAMAEGWADMPLRARQAVLHKIADVIEGRIDEFVALETEDVGIPSKFARMGTVGQVPYVFRLYAEELGTYTDRTWNFARPDGGKAHAYTARRPRGVVGLIAPWNVPLLLMMFKVAPAMAMGNAILAKPSEMTAQTTTLMAEVFEEAGVPAGVYNVINGPGATSGDAILTHKGIAAFGFTGATSTGQRVMQAASVGFREVSLELGGKNPSVIFADADLEKVLPGSFRSCFFNAGQICFCTERMYVARPLFDEFVEKSAHIAKNVAIGDPTDPAVMMGPQVTHAHRDGVIAAVERAIADGGTLVAGGKAPDFGDEKDEGAFMLPTIITGLPETAEFVTEEVFGPVVHIAPFDTEEEAIALANNTRYGLAASIWTEDLSRAHRVAPQIAAGQVWVNAWQLRELHSPLVGFGDSGAGFPQGGKESLDFFSEASTITISI